MGYWNGEIKGVYAWWWSGTNKFCVQSSMGWVIGMGKSRDARLTDKSGPDKFEKVIYSRVYFRCSMLPLTLITLITLDKLTFIQQIFRI